MAKSLTIEVHSKYTFWYYFMKFLLFVKLGRLCISMMDKDLVRIYCNGKFYSSIKLNMMGI